jgi:hypothetical protein
MYTAARHTVKRAVRRAGSEDSSNILRVVRSVARYLIRLCPVLLPEAVGAFKSMLAVDILSTSPLYLET